MTLLSATTSTSRRQAFCHFSQHAFLRLKQRSSLFCEEVSALLDSGLTVNVGSEVACNRDHLLFYSSQDDCCLIAIQDVLTGKVVTILPLDYHENLAWPVSDAQQEKAKALAMTLTRKGPSKQAVSVFILSAHYMAPDGYMKTKRIYSFAAADYDNNLSVLISDKHLRRTLTEALADKGIDPRDLMDVSVRAGSRGDPIFLDLQPNAIQPDKAVA